MSKPTNDQLAYLLDHAIICRECGPYIEPILELQRWRAMRASEKERVRSVVKSEILRLITTDGPVATEDEADVIAGRAAEQLAGTDIPSGQELKQLLYLRSECVLDDYPAAVQYLDRVLARSKP